MHFLFYCNKHLVYVHLYVSPNISMERRMRQVARTGAELPSLRSPITRLHEEDTEH